MAGTKLSKIATRRYCHSGKINYDTFSRACRKNGASKKTMHVINTRIRRTERREIAEHLDSLVETDKERREREYQEMKFLQEAREIQDAFTKRMYESLDEEYFSGWDAMEESDRELIGMDEYYENIDLDIRNHSQ